MNKGLSRQKLISIGVGVAIFDQITKLFIINTLNNFETITFIPYILALSLVKNTGAAFSLFQNSTNLLTFLSFLVTSLLILWIWNNEPFNFFQGIGIALLLGGALGNGIDRIRLGYVIDFIVLIPIDFPIFNIADISINMAILIIFLDIFRRKGIRK